MEWSPLFGWLLVTLLIPMYPDWTTDTCVLSWKQGFCLCDKNLCNSLISYEFWIKSGSLCLPDKGQEFYYSRCCYWSFTLPNYLGIFTFSERMMYVFFSFSIHLYSLLLSTTWQGKHPKDGQPVIVKIARVGFTVRHGRTIASVPEVFHLFRPIFHFAITL